MKKTLLLLTAFFAVSAFFCITPDTASAFEWPQQIPETNAFSDFFGENRGQTLNTSLVFSEPQTVSASESGTLIMKFDASNNEEGWFPSTLGNAVILSHDNGMITVYGNLDSITIDESAKDVSQGAELGRSGQSGWNGSRKGLEFLVCDTKINTTINPLILMPEVFEPFSISIQNPVIYNRNGIAQPVENGTRVPADIYRLYIAPQTQTMTYKTTVSVNGSTAETILYNILKPDNQELVFSGKSNYCVHDIFPDSTRQFIGEIILNGGQNLISITVTDLLGNEKTATFTVDCR